MIEHFTYRMGRNLKIALLDPFNPEYCRRVEAVAEPVRPVYETWEAFRELTHRLPENLRTRAEEQLEPELNRPQHLAYMIRKLAEMLSAVQIRELQHRPFIRQALKLNGEVFLEPHRGDLESWSRAEKAMKMVYRGFSAIQCRLDHEMPPFPETGIEIIDPSPSRRRPCGISRQGELIFTH